MLLTASKREKNTHANAAGRLKDTDYMHVDEMYQVLLFFLDFSIPLENIKSQFFLPFFRNSE